MMNQQFYIARLIAKYLSEDITEEELVKLIQWRNESPGNESLFQKISEEENIKQNIRKRQSFHTENGWESVQQKIWHHRFRNRMITVCKYAAILILPIAIATIALYRNADSKLPDATLTQQILPGSKKAILTLANGETIDLKSAPGMQLTEKDGTLIQVDSTALNYQKTSNAASGEIAYNRIDVPRGGEYQLTLSDGSKVHMNSMSSLRFPIRFAKDSRMIELEGEAYFEVSKTGQPFIVKVKGMDVQVLGTTFNISAYPNEEIQTTLVSGSVKVQTANGTNRILHPSEQACIPLGSNHISVRYVDTTFYTSWIQGKINFKDQRLEDIMKTLARWYDMNVIYMDQQTKDLRFGCYVNRYNEITPLVELLEETGKISIKIEGKNIQIKTNN